MVADRVIERYAIGAAVGATFYLEPVSTLDVDIFIELHAGPGSVLLTPDYLLDSGCMMEGEQILISGWPVQLIPPPSPLVAEALANATELEVNGLSTRVFTPNTSPQSPMCLANCGNSHQILPALGISSASN